MKMANTDLALNARKDMGSVEERKQIIRNLCGELQIHRKIQKLLGLKNS